MVDGDLRNIETTFSRVKKTCKAIKILCMVVLGLFLALWLAVAVFLVVGAVANGFDSGSIFSLATILVYGAIVAALLFIAVRVFSDVDKGESPFSAKQVKRLRLAAILFLAFALFGLVMPETFTFSNAAGGYNLGIDRDAGGDSPFLNVNAGAVIAAAVLYCLSVAFEYGILLQNFSDETL